MTTLAVATIRVLLIVAVVLAAIYWLVKQPFVTPRASVPPAVDAAALEAHVRALSERFHPRSFDRPDKLEAAADYVKSVFLRVGAEVAEQRFPVEEALYRNIIARFGPKQGRLLVIGAHYDSVAPLEGWTEGADPESYTPGADDNASGVAVLLELARLLARSPPKIGVELVAYALEEPPHFRTEAMGSSWHASELRKSGREPVLMIALEMVGYFSTDPGSQAYPIGLLSRIYPDRGNFVAIVGRLQDWAVTRRVKAAMLGASDLPVESINAPPVLPGVDFSDHLSYWSEGFPALMVTDTAFYRNPNYHGAGDTADRLDYPSMAKVVQGIEAVVRGYGEGSR